MGARLRLNRARLPVTAPIPAYCPPAIVVVADAITIITAVIAPIVVTVVMPSAIPIVTIVIPVIASAAMAVPMVAIIHSDTEAELRG